MGLVNKQKLKIPHLQVLQDQGPVFAEGGDEGEGAGVLGRDAVGDGRGDADDFLEHLDECVVFVLAGFDLAGFHAEGGFEVHPLQSAGRKLVTLCRSFWARKGR